MQLDSNLKYNVAALPQLEQDVAKQIATGTWDLDICLTVLRFYLIDPEHTNMDILMRILLKAMMRLPHPDFKVCQHMVHHRILTQEPITQIVELAELLQSGEYKSFWEKSAPLTALLDSVAGFTQAVQDYIAGTTAFTYQRVPRKVLSQAVKLEGAELESFLKTRVQSRGWRTMATPTGEVLIMPRNDFNQPVEHEQQELTRIDKIPELFAAS